MRSSLRWLIVVLILAAAAAASAETHGRGYAPPADWDRIFQERLRVFPAEKDDLPAVWDWRDLDGVTPAKNQGQCGSCWAFAAAGEMEAKIRIAYGGRILDLSEQQIVSCNPYGSGCGGGWAGSAYYVFQHRGGVTEDAMPYEGSDAVPCTDDQYLGFTDLDSWYTVANDVTQIKQAVLEGPVCTSVATDDEFEDYTGGCLDQPGGPTDHLVLIVGWDDHACDGEGAWIIKNSWGSSWGQAGFGYVKYGACSIGTGVTALRYTPPPVDVHVTSPTQSPPLSGGGPVTIAWTTSGAATAAVDIWYGHAGLVHDTLVADDTPNTGSFTWTLPNVTTARASFLVTPAAGTGAGFGFSAYPLVVMGHQTRYVSAAGSNTFPYDTPDRAAHTIADAVLAGAGYDTVKVAAGEYLESIAVNSPCVIAGGYDAGFTHHDPTVQVTRVRGVSSAVRFSAAAGAHCGVRHVTFHDCGAAVGSTPVPGSHGAAILSLGASPTIEDCAFVDNRAPIGGGVGWGGAVLLHGGAPVVRRCEFTGNVASHGGALALSQNAGALVEDCDFTGNGCTVVTGDYRGAAAFVSGGAATLRRCRFEDNGPTVAGGAVALVDGAQGVLEHCDLLANQASYGGGGAYLAGGSLVCLGGTWRGNLATGGRGGGLLAEGGALEARHVVFAANQAAALGGGVMASSVAGGAIEHCVFHGNAAAQFGGLLALPAGTFAARHNVVVANGGGGSMVAGPSATSDYNLAWQNPAGDFLSAMGAHDRVADPCLVDPAGGDVALGLHSAALDEGDPDPACQDPDGSRADLGVHGGPAAATVAPPAIAGATLTRLGDQAWRVAWAPSPAGDVATYVVYADTAAVFVPAAERVVAQVAHPATSCDVAFGEGYFLVVAVDADGHVGGYSVRLATGAGTTAAPGSPPAALAIAGVAPNPFNPRTTVQLDVPREGRVTLRVYDPRGRLVAAPLDDVLSAGRHAVVWDGRDHAGRPVAAGLYLLRLDDGRRQVTAKAVLAK